MKFTREELNLLFRIVENNAPFLAEHKFFLITPEMILNHDLFDGEDSLLDLAGYKVKIQVEGDHRHDSQMVDYGFTFKSPAGKQTTIWTEMCLMCSWNHGQEEEII